MKNSLLFAILFLLGCQSKTKLEDIDFNLRNISFPDSAIVSAQDELNLSDFNVYRIDSSIYELATYKIMHAIIYDSLGNVLNADVCFEYFPDHLLSRINKAESLKIKKPKYADSSFYYYADHIYNMVTKESLASSVKNLKTHNILIFWDMSLVNLYKKLEINSFVSECSNKDNINVFFVNCDMR